jgi:hypothetical protein
MTKEMLRKLINESLGETSALFMSQPVKGCEMVMPTEELIRISETLVDKLLIP